MANIAIFRINYKSDFVLTLHSDAGWLTPFCIKFWTGAPSQAYFAGYDGTTYTHCAPVDGEPTKLSVQFDDHHLSIGDLKFQIGYHFTVADFPNDTEDEVLNQASVIIEKDDKPMQVMLDLNGETAPEIEFSLPAYANEAQRIANEEQRINDEQQRISNEEGRISAEEGRQAHELQRIHNEETRIEEFAQLKADAISATGAANNAATLANDKADLAQQKADYAQTQGDYAKAQGDYAKAQGDYAKAQGDTALADHERAEADHDTSTEDHTQASSDHDRAESDHSQAAQDHDRAESDHAAVEVYVDSLGAFDISSYHATGGVLAKYADLAAALGTNGANVPDDLRKGGMSVKFVQSSDNKYVQYRLMSDTFNATPTNWQGVDDEPTAGSDNLVKSKGVYDFVHKETGYYKNTVNKTLTVGHTFDTVIVFDDLDIHAGDMLKFKITGTTSAVRLVLKANSASGTYYIKDNIVIGTMYDVTVSQDITSIWLSYNGDVDVKVELYISLALSALNGADALSLSNANAQEIGYHNAALIEEASSMVHKTIMTNIGIAQGEPFSFKLEGTHSGDRILLRYNSISGENIQDFCTIGTTYYKVASTALNSIVLYHNGNIDIVIEVDNSIKYQTNKNAYDIASLLSDTNDIHSDVSELNEDVFNKKTTLIDTTGAAPYEQFIDFFAVAGTEVTVKVKSLSNQSVTISAVDPLNNVRETIHSGSLTNGQVVTDTFSSTRNIYKIRILASSRGKLEITTINTSLKEELAKTIDDVSDRLSVVEQDISGSEKSEELDIREYDMVNNDAIDIPISGSAYSLVKFCIDNPNDVGVQVKLFYRKTNQRSVELGLFSASDRNSAEVIYEIPDDFISLRYAVYNSQRRIITLRTELNPYIEDNGFEEAVSSNVLDVSALTEGHALNPSTGEDSTWTVKSYTDYICVKQGDILVLSNNVATLSMTNTTGRPNNPRPLEMRYIAAYDYNKNLLPSLGSDPNTAYTKYTVPKGVYYVRITAATEVLKGDGARINCGGIILPYEVYWKGTRPSGVTANSMEIKNMCDFPVTKMPVYLRNIVSYRPLGQLSKGYLCVSDDDGTIGLGTYTLPMVIQKDVPITFMVMKESAIFQEGNEQYKELLLTAVNEHGCSVGQHGAVNWTDYNEKQLYEYFKQQNDFWDSLGIKVGSAGCPSGWTNNIIEAVAGGIFGVHRANYDGYDKDNVINHHAIHTDNYASFARSNVYCLSSCNVRDKSLQGWKDTIDWAVENKLLLNVYFHDFDFVETATDYAARRELLEGFLDYAKEHITMVNLEDIPRLV